MKSIKLPAFLVTLLVTSSIALHAADLPKSPALTETKVKKFEPAPEMHAWTDITGRTMNGQLLMVIDADFVHVKREDGATFIINVKNLSPEDAAYVKSQWPAWLKRIDDNNKLAAANEARAALLEKSKALNDSRKRKSYVSSTLQSSPPLAAIDSR
jgi:hypothetical protein